MKSYQLVKYRHKYSYGIDKKWQYLEIPDMEFLKKCGYENIGEWLSQEEGVSDDLNYSEQYRGFEYEVIPHLPVDEIIKKLNRSKSNLKYYKRMIKKYRKMLDEVGHITKNDFNV